MEDFIGDLLLKLEADIKECDERIKAEPKGILVDYLTGRKHALEVYVEVIKETAPRQQVATMQLVSNNKEVKAQPPAQLFGT